MHYSTDNMNIVGVYAHFFVRILNKHIYSQKLEFCVYLSISWTKVFCKVECQLGVYGKTYSALKMHLYKQAENA